MSIKDFQEYTAQRILEDFKSGQRRVLLADEVGLGKTFVARRVIELVKEWHKTELHKDFFKVVYICSNANIADQNIEKLGVDNRMKISESRLSMQHLHITLANKEIRDKAKQGEMPESIIPLTPSTSFRLTNSCGTANERALMYCLLKRMPQLADIDEALSEFMRFDVASWSPGDYEEKIAEAGVEYVSKMMEHLEVHLSAETLEDLRSLATRKEKTSYGEKAAVFSKLRQAFALISIDMLDPDLVIMDEFQRFSDLLHTYPDGQSEQAMLTQSFFNDRSENTKILLLSATPYKPYSTLEELNTDGKDEHYQDFIKVVDFLLSNKKEATEDFRNKWQKYSAALKRTDVKNLTPLQEAKDEAERALYRIMCRTERFNSGIIKDYTATKMGVLQGDILSYAQGQKLLETLSHVNSKLGNMPIEYVKSSPYLLSFMDKYELKKRVVNALNASCLTHFAYDALLLNKRKINTYTPISPNNGKLKYLHDIVFGARHEKKTHLLLWVPTSHPYYHAGGIFDSEEARRFSKVILFSSWEMVPRMVSCMMSYYAELYTIGEIKKKFNPNLRYLSEENLGDTDDDQTETEEPSKMKRKRRKQIRRLRAGNPLEYPCQTLADLYSPKDYYGQDLSAIQKVIAREIALLLNQHENISKTPQRGSAENIVALMKALDGTLSETEHIPFVQKDAIEILTDIAIASPAVCALRQSGDSDDAKVAAKAIVRLFNKAESAAIIDLLYSKKSDDFYYQSVLDYCAIGNLQAVLDEYAHMLQTDRIGKHLNDAIIGSSHLNVDTNTSLDNEEKRLSMRNHFAVPFVDKTITNKSLGRTYNIRKSFNSPFRPFILSSTSIGQEGLDFHWYARKIVHWNLPSNPVDLEQREGRINRYKCLALRRNVSKLFGQYFDWDEMFYAARERLKGNYSDMVPFWCLPVNDLTAEQRSHLEYIERIVPIYPLSRDTYRYARLLDVLSLYRMTLGQPRQEELLNLLKDMNLCEEDLKSLTIDLCPYNKRGFVCRADCTTDGTVDTREVE